MTVNWVVFLCAMVFLVAQNNYFGWHLSAKSDAEIIVDGITILIFALSFVTWEK